MNKNNFLRIKFNDAGDESLSHTLKAYHLIDKLLEKTDHKYVYDIDVKETLSDYFEISVGLVSACESVYRNEELGNLDIL